MRPVRPQSTGATRVPRLSEYNELLASLQEGARSLERISEQQQEVIQYLDGLNTRLERDVINRQFELRHLGGCIDQLREELLHRDVQPPTPLVHRPPSATQIVGHVPVGGVIIPPIPDRVVSRQSRRSEIVVPSALSDNSIPYPARESSHHSDYPHPAHYRSPTSDNSSRHTMRHSRRFSNF